MLQVSVVELLASQRDPTLGRLEKVQVKNKSKKLLQNELLLLVLPLQQLMEYQKGRTMTMMTNDFKTLKTKLVSSLAGCTIRTMMKPIEYIKTWMRKWIGDENFEGLFSLLFLIISALFIALDCLSIPFGYG